MLVPIEWVKEFVPIELSVEELAEKLTLAGLKVEGILYPFAQGKIVCAEVVETLKHPQSDKLKVCKVYDGESIYTTVTSDMKVEKGSKIPVAFPSSKLANGEIVKPVNIKGIISEVVMCSLEELGLEPRSDGICLLNQIGEDLPVGADVVECWRLADPVLDIEVTPNRPDCLGVLGIAREIGGLTGKSIVKPVASYNVSDATVDEFVGVTIEDVDGCPRYCAAYIDGLTVKPSPIWMRRRLMACGVRPINNLVDATNYVMLETGHPTHAFDHSKISEGLIVVRKAKKGEKVRLLDEKEYQLNGHETLITDPQGILAVGGVMGAADSAVSERTNQAVLEVAYFNPVRIRRTAKSLGIKSDASYRFERGVDPNGLTFVMERLLTVVQSVCGGSAAKGFVDRYPVKAENLVLNLRKQRISALLGVDPKEESTRILESLGMKVEDSEEILKVTVPTFRPDISMEEDLIEEVGRVYGYSKVEPVAPRILIRGRGWSEKQLFRKRMREHLLSLGFDETINMSFCCSKVVSKFTSCDLVRLLNPLTEEMDCLRPSLLFGLMDSLAFNYRRQIRDIKYFEIAKTFYLSNGVIHEKESLGMIATGRVEEENYRFNGEIDFYIFRGYLDSIADRLGIEFAVEPSYCQWFVPGRSAVVKLGDEQIGKIGMLVKDLLEIYDVKGEIYFLELDLDKLFVAASKPKRSVKILSGFPAIRRDISLLIPNGVYSGGIVKHLVSSSEWVEKAGVSDMYKGKDIPEGMTSVTFYVIYRAQDRSLTDEEVNSVFEKTIVEIEQKFGVKRRFA